MRCACGADALTEDARFCVGCGAPFPDAQPGAPDTATLVVAAPPETGSPQPDRAERGAVRASTPRRAARRAVATPLAGPEPVAPATVPLPVVIGGVVVLLVVLLVLLVSA